MNLSIYPHLDTASAPGQALTHHFVAAGPSRRQMTYLFFCARARESVCAVSRSQSLVEMGDTSHSLADELFCEDKTAQSRSGDC